MKITAVLFSFSVMAFFYFFAVGAEEKAVGAEEKTVSPVQQNGVKENRTENLKTDLLFQEEEEVGKETGFPIPRYVSLKSNKINLRTGPGFRYPVEWVFQRKYLPIMVIEEFKNWRQVKTHDGVIGWLHKTMITGVRTFRVLDDIVSLMSKPGTDTAQLAELAPGVVGILKRCQINWCYVEVKSKDHGNVTGWLPKKHLFGVHAGELFKN